MRSAKPSTNFSMPPESSIPSRTWRLLALILALVLISRMTARAEFFEKVHDSLSLNDSHDRFHLQLSGLVDLEAYLMDQPAPGLIFSSRNFLFSPRLRCSSTPKSGRTHISPKRAWIAFHPSATAARSGWTIFCPPPRRRTSASRSDNSPPCRQLSRHDPGRIPSSTRRCLTKI